MELSNLRRAVDRKLQDYRAAHKTSRREKRELKRLLARQAALKEAQALAQHVAQSVQTQAHKQISLLVTKCLQTVFDDDTSFKIAFERKRGKTEARLLFLDSDGDELDPLTANGGGLIDVAAFGLRLAAIALSKPKLRPALFLDEPFKMVSAEFRPRVRSMIKQLAEENKVQVIQVTHDPQLVTGKIIRITR